MKSLSLTPRQRVLAAIAHEEPDRVPITVAFNKSTTSGVFRSNKASAFQQFLDYSGARDEEELLQKLGVDIRPVRDRERKDLSWRQNPKNAFNPDTLSKITSLSEFEKLEWPDHNSIWDYSGLEEELRRIKSLPAEYAIIAPDYEVGIQIYEIAWGLRGMEHFFIDLAANPKLVEAMLERITYLYTQRTKAVLQRLGKEVDIVGGGDDLGMQDRLQFSPETFRKIFKPHYLKAYSEVRSISSAAIHFHCCGSCVDILDDLIDVGVNILHPIQPMARGMDLAELKKRFGKHLTFHGGIDTQRVVPFGTVEEVKAETIKCFEILGKGGGYILGPSHCFQPNDPMENIAAIYKAAQEECVYRKIPR